MNIVVLVKSAVDEAETRGARGFLGKPFDPQRLIDQAKQILPT